MAVGMEGSFALLDYKCPISLNPLGNTKATKEGKPSASVSESSEDRKDSGPSTITFAV